MRISCICCPSEDFEWHLLSGIILVSIDRLVVQECSIPDLVCTGNKEEDQKEVDEFIDMVRFG